MKGQILDYSVQNNAGFISGDDQRRYAFTGAEWRGQIVPSRGQLVDFEIAPSGQALNVYVLSHPLAFSGQVGSKNRIVAAILAFFLGGFGVHKFYLGQIGWGIIYLLFCWTFIPALVAFIEFIIYLCTSDKDFARKYG
ncbi:TM2 domain-containing protein [Acinetobacter sp. ANC 4470]|uniref:TM2 domain-containing protein n=1 Tax=Acinetobacter sp. ANC 4470 TaxID=1977881 RepID=UPI001178B207|nr:TM2 domain-containing protein [Acinetobacter sp. ANC 4470]